MVRLLLGIALMAVFVRAWGQDPMQYGRAYIAEGDYAAAAQSYGVAVRLNPFDPVAHNNLAVSKAANGDYQAAMDLLTRAVQLAPDRADIRQNLGNLRDWMDHYTGAAGVRAQVPSFTPPPARVLPDPPALWAMPRQTQAVPIRALPQPSAVSAGDDQQRIGASPSSRRSQMRCTGDSCK